METTHASPERTDLESAAVMKRHKADLKGISSKVPVLPLLRELKRVSSLFTAE